MKTKAWKLYIPKDHNNYNDLLALGGLVKFYRGDSYDTWKKVDYDLKVEQISTLTNSNYFEARTLSTAEVLLEIL